jgi:hypothetical protein
MAGKDGAPGFMPADRSPPVARAVIRSAPRVETQPSPCPRACAARWTAPAACSGIWPRPAESAARSRGQDFLIGAEQLPARFPAGRNAPINLVHQINRRTARGRHAAGHEPRYPRHLGIDLHRPEPLGGAGVGATGGPTNDRRMGWHSDISRAAPGRCRPAGGIRNHWTGSPPPSVGHRAGHWQSSNSHRIY